MRGLTSSALLWAPALASAFVVPELDVEDGGSVFAPNEDHLFAPIVVNIVDLQSHDHHERPVEFALEVFESESACGYGNVTLDGQALPQIVEGDSSSGQGPVTTENGIILGAWSFNCIKVNGVPNAQLLRFKIQDVDGTVVQDTGFYALYHQSGSLEILNIETDLSIPIHIVANPNPEGLRPISDDPRLPEYNVEEELAELDYFYAQLRELEWLIFEKEQALSEHHSSQQLEETIKDCDSLRCIVQAAADQARNAAHSIYSKVRGDIEEHDEEAHGWPRPPFKKPHFPHPKFPHRPHDGNHTCDHPKFGHGNHTHGNHTFPPPPWKLPHHRPLPICKYPPPHHGPHHGPPHGPPPHGKPPGDHSPGGRPEWEHKPDFHRRPSDEDGPHGKPPGDREPGGPPEWEQEPVPDDRHKPDFHHSPDVGNEPDFHRGPEEEDRHHPPPPPHHEEPHSSPGPDHDEPHPKPGDSHRPPHAPDIHHPPHHPILHVVKLTVIGFLFAFLLLSLHHRVCTPKRRADRHRRKEKRRAHRRAVHKYAITKLLARISGNGDESSDSGSDDYEEKRSFLRREAQEVVQGEIAELRVAADVVGDMVAAEEGRATTIIAPAPAPVTVITQAPATEVESRPLLQQQLLEHVGHGEELPAYEDHDGSDLGSVVADGFGYTPGGNGYTPSHSSSGGVSDILGPDTKS